MKKEYVLGGLAVVGAIALIMYLKPKPKKNSDGFFGANGMAGRVAQTKDNCAWCKTPSGQMYHTGEDRNCKSGDRCSSRYAYYPSSSQE
jgi:hypothetical protein